MSTSPKSPTTLTTRREMIIAGACGLAAGGDASNGLSELSLTTKSSQ